MSGSWVCKVSSYLVDAAQSFPREVGLSFPHEPGMEEAHPTSSRTLGGVAFLTLFWWVLSALLEPDKWSPRPCALGLCSSALRSAKGLEGYHLES